MKIILCVKAFLCMHMWNYIYTTYAFTHRNNRIIKHLFSYYAIVNRNTLM